MTRQVSGDASGGWWEDSRGFIKGRKLRVRYHEACKALKRARLAVLDCINDDRLAALREEETKCQEAVQEVEAEVKRDKF